MGIFDKAIQRVMDMREATMYVPELILDSYSEKKMGWLKGGGRDFEQLTPKLKAKMVEAYAAGMASLANGTSKDAMLPARMAGEAFKQEMITRLANGGGEVKGAMKPLAASTIARKGHSRIGYDTGGLFMAMTKARVLIKKKGSK